MVKINISKEGITINNTDVTKMDIEIFDSIFGNHRNPEGNLDPVGSRRQVPEIDSNNDEIKIIIWDNFGVFAHTKDLTTLLSFSLQFSDDPGFIPNWDKKIWRPNNNYSGEFYINGKSYIKYMEKDKERRYVEVKSGNNRCIFSRITEKQEFFFVEINHTEPKMSSNKYVQQKVQGEVLFFKNFNFKLSVIEELMFTKKLLKPEFDVYDFVKDYNKREIDIDSEGYEIIPEVKKYFQNLEINKNLAKEIEELNLDGGNTIYGQLCPFWDGEDDLFTIKSISEDEIIQFPNLKKITDTLLENNNKIMNLLKKYKIEIVS